MNKKQDDQISKLMFIFSPNNPVHFTTEEDGTVRAQFPQGIIVFDRSGLIKEVVAVPRHGYYTYYIKAQQIVS